jgi:DNA-binding NarL/FixJ family response regulator
VVPVDEGRHRRERCGDGRLLGGSADEALALAQQPDVVLMVVPMQAASRLYGIDATRQSVQASPRIGVIMLTLLEDDDSVFAAMRAGARGYRLKGADKREVFKILRAVAEGVALFGTAIARQIMTFFGRPGTGAHSQAPLAFPYLTERELEILGLIAQGLNNGTIAERLVIIPLHSISPGSNHPAPDISYQTPSHLC